MHPDPECRPSVNYILKHSRVRRARLIRPVLKTKITIVSVSLCTCTCTSVLAPVVVFLSNDNRFSSILHFVINNNNNNKIMNNK